MKELKNLPTFEEFINEGKKPSASVNEKKDVLDITTIEDPSILKNEIRDRWPSNLTYKGEEFFDSLYMNKIIPAAKKILGIDDMTPGQESYLGYLVNDDVFISGWDVFEGPDGDEVPDNIVFLKYENGKLIDVSKKYNIYSSGNFYGSPRSGYQKIKAKFKDLVDIRLD